MDVGVHAAHDVVHHRAHRNQFVHRVQVGVLQTQLAHERQLLVDHLLAYLADVQVDVVAVRPFQRASPLLLLDERLRQPVARAELHRPQHRLRLRLAEVVVLQVTVAVLVHQPAAFRPGGFGNQDAGGREPGGVVLDELHVLERGARPVGQSHPVTVLDIGVGGEGEYLAAAAGAQDHGLRHDAVDLARRNLDGDDAGAAAVVHQQARDEPLVVALDAPVLERRLEQRVQHVEAGLVGGKPGSFNLHAAERPHGHAAVRLAAPRTAPVLELHHLAGRLIDERLDSVLVAQPVGAGHRVVGVRLQAVLSLDYRRRPPFGRHRVAPHGVNLRDDGDIQVGSGLGRGYAGAEAGAAAADDKQVTGITRHGRPLGALSARSRIEKA